MPAPSIATSVLYHSAEGYDWLAFVIATNDTWVEAMEDNWNVTQPEPGQVALLTVSPNGSIGSGTFATEGTEAGQYSLPQFAVSAG